MMCKHRKRLFISRETGTGTDIEPYRKSASVCAECGTFLVWINGVQMTFALVTDEQVVAAGQYARMLTRPDPILSAADASAEPYNALLKS